MQFDLDGVYAAIEDEAAFGQLSSRLAEAVGTRSAIFVELNAAAGVEGMQACYWTPEFMEFYAAHFAANDPWTALAIDAGRFGRAVALDAFMPPEEFALTEMRNECFLALGDDTGRCLGVMPELGKPGVMMAVHKAASGKPFTDVEAARLDGVYSHVQRVVKLRRLFDQQRDRVARLQDLVDKADHGLVRVDSELQVHALSARARAILDDRDGLSFVRNRIVGSAEFEAQLKFAVRGVIEKRAGTPTGLLCHRPSGLRAYRIAVLPAGFASDAGAILKLDDPEQAEAMDTFEALRSAYGLTPMEGVLARGLLNEQSIEEIAARRGVSRESIKTQLKSVFGKMGVNRQSDLVKMLSKFPSI